MTRSMGAGDDIRGTRLYVAGDDLRHVHWKSTARKSQLVVKEFHTTVQEQTLVVWDGAQIAAKSQRRPEKKSAATSSDMPNIGFNATDWSLRLAASLCRALLESRRPCALLRLDSAPLALGMNDDGISSGLTMAQVSEALADARADRMGDGSETLLSFQARWNGGEVYVVTTSDSDALALITRLKRQGVRVTVGLVNASAFAPAPLLRNGGREYSRPPADKDKTATATAQSLRAAGARVVMVSPQPASRDFYAPIRDAVRKMLEPLEQDYLTENFQQQAASNKARAS
jgi:uncharacterized protein (DUF58 family)